MKQIFTLLVLIAATFVRPPTAHAQTANVADSLVLVNLYDSTNGPGWVNNSGWLAGPVSAWNGITLDVNGRVIIISLTSNNLVGAIPSSLGNLSLLQRLSLDSNHLSGLIPNAVGNLIAAPNFFVLTLSGNLLSGPVPASLGNRNYYLNDLELQHNHLTFDGMELIASDPRYGKLVYAPQDSALNIHFINGKLSVTAGGTLSNNTYQWNLNNTPVQTITGDSTFTPTAAGSYTVAITNSVATALTLHTNTYILSQSSLPLTLLNFTGQLQHGNAMLDWQTASEINTSYFNIQRSLDGAAFTNVGKVNATGTSAITQSYTYTDVLSGITSNPPALYYRLQEVDKDGTGNYSKIIMINLPSNAMAVTIYPNPVRDQLNLQLKGITGKCSISICGVEGKKQQTQQFEAVSNGQYVILNTSKLAAGVYIVQVEQNGKSVMEKFVKL